MAELVSPSVHWHASWLESREEWGRGVHQDGTGLHPDDEVDSATGFAEWVERLRTSNDPTVALPEGKVPADYWWIVEGERYLGAITLRYRLNDFLLEQGGHIGYGLRPSARGHGLAGWALATVLQRARAVGLQRVLLTCDDTNLASARTIEKNGGVLEDVRDVDGRRMRRYWIELSPAAAGTGR
jgi:predicted acetyltransferase